MLCTLRQTRADGHTTRRSGMSMSPRKNGFKLMLSTAALVCALVAAMKTASGTGAVNPAPSVSAIPTGPISTGPVTTAPSTPVAAAAAPTHDDLVTRGQYLVTIAGCADCHTPSRVSRDGAAEPDVSRMFAGHPEDSKLSPTLLTLGIARRARAAASANTAFTSVAGTCYAANLTPDRLTGIGSWSEDDFLHAIRRGKHWGEGRAVQSPMPWRSYGQMSDDDLRSVYAYLESLPAVRNSVPDFEPSTAAAQ
jgi:mono/diheme cytochrome c family protein